MGEITISFGTGNCKFCSKRLAVTDIESTCQSCMKKEYRKKRSDFGIKKKFTKRYGEKKMDTQVNGYPSIAISQNKKSIQ